MTRQLNARAVQKGIEMRRVIQLVGLILILAIVGAFCYQQHLTAVYLAQDQEPSVTDGRTYEVNIKNNIVYVDKDKQREWSWIDIGIPSGICFLIIFSFATVRWWRGPMKSA